jgi:D-aminopeptidase
MIVVATDAPLDARNLNRLASRAMLGLGLTGGIAANGSGDYVIAFSTAESLRIPYQQRGHLTNPVSQVRNDAMTALFLAVIEATEEALLNSLLMAQDMTGHKGSRAEAMPVEDVRQIWQDYRP